MDEADFLNDTSQLVLMATLTTTISNDFHLIENEYCGHQLKVFQKQLTAIYGVLTCITCSIGMLTNILNIVVLTRKNMSYSSTNALLTSIAVIDLLFLISILIYDFIQYEGTRIDICVKHSYAIQSLLLVTVWTAAIANRISVMLTFILAVWRYIAVNFPLRAQILCSFNRAIVAIVASYILVPISTTSMYLSLTVSPVDSLDEGKTAMLYVVVPRRSSSHCSSLFDVLPTQLAKSSNGSLWYAAFWVYSVLYKILLPMAVMVISIVLVRSLKLGSRRHLELAHNSLTTTDRSFARTTRMLLAILIMFIVAEVPRGILTMLHPALGKQFHDSCYRPLFEVMELLDILNSSLNFVLYCTMSKQFRKTFMGLFTNGFHMRAGQDSPSPCTTRHVEKGEAKLGPRDC